MCICIYIYTHYYVCVCVYIYVYTLPVFHSCLQLTCLFNSNHNFTCECNFVSLFCRNSATFKSFEDKMGNLKVSRLLV